jgi:zinc/manganese transport system substrate-binding protein
MMKNIFLALALIVSPLANAKLKVVASTADVGALVKEVGGSDIDIDAIAKGTQDPHAIEPKPSYMLKMNGADLVVANGLSLEVGWLPSLIAGSRNPKIHVGTPGYLDLGLSADPIDIPQGGISRAGGDVHPDGNPHFTLDPLRTGKLAGVIAERLGQLDPAHKADFEKRAVAFKKEMDDKIKSWQQRLDKSGIKKVVTYHPSLNYFLARFHIAGAGFLEPKPGIPPTASHILEVIALVKTQKIPLILVDNFYDPKIADRIVQEAPGTKIKTIGIAVGSAPNLNRLPDVTEEIVKAFEEAAK